ncbi:hypothetical protein N9K49_00630 [Flavobacteriaceae bacterium]|nr:hypothetical protein [Flavobacteriaceae bacterium]
MKNIILIFLILNSFNIINAQNTIEIQCLGENIIKSGNIIKRNSNTGTIFSINEYNKEIKVTTASRFEKSIDIFKIIKKISTEYAVAFNCKKSNDTATYNIIIKDKSVGILLHDGILIESKIISVKEFEQPKSKNNEIDYYIYYDDWKEIDIEKVKKNTKKNSLLSGTYEKNPENSISIIELKDNKIYFKLNLFNGRNIGILDGIIENKQSVIFEKKDFGLCKFKIKFSKTTIEINTIENGNECGYGNGIISDGIFHLTSKEIPKLEE